MDKKKLLLIDGSSVAFRAFFALYQQLDRFKNAAGLHTNAIYGFQLMLSHLLERVEPSHILVAFDAGKTTFRTEMYADYKGGRAKTPDEFREQFPFIRELLDHMEIRHYELAQYEADDIIGTLDKLAEQDGFDITIVSGDKDLIQLDKALVEGGYQTKMLLQVHDEIVLEVPNSELAEMKKLVKQTMEEAIQLSVPLIADENERATWYEAK